MLGSDWLQHVYALRSEYDLASRRIKLHHPDQLDPCSGSCQQTYGFHAVTGTLDTLVHPSTTGGTLTTRFAYDNNVRLTQTFHPGSVTTTRIYDSEGRITARTGPGITDASLTYEATGRIISGSAYHALTGGTQNLVLGYGGLGAPQWTSGVAVGVTDEEFKTDALGNRLWVRDPEMVDGIDRTRYHGIASNTGQLDESTLGTAACAIPGAAKPSCHPTWYVYEYFQAHDPSGNVKETWGLDTRGWYPTHQTVPEESRSYYAADEKLVYFNRHLGWSTPGEGGGTFDEYRYDALGRRVYSRSRRPSTCSYPCEAYVERTVWDGDQVLYEIRSSGKPGVAETYMNQEGGVDPTDDPNQYGIVAYAQGPGIDQPVGILKKYSGTWAYVTPHPNWRGDWSHGTFSTGSLCLTVGAACPYWPGFYQTADGSAQGQTPPTYTVWWGSLIRDRTDASGLVYLRNRYYDPKTGRFTQEDPIGLAGGLNLYGFANGDPVNFSDPFGLLPCPPLCGDKYEALQSPGLLDPTLWVGGLARGVVRGIGKLLASRATSAAETVLFEGGKDALKEALAGGVKGVNSKQAVALLETLKEGSADVIKVVTGENGLVSYTTRAGRNGYQTLVRIFDESGQLKRMAQAAWDAAGRFVHGEVWK